MQYLKIKLTKHGQLTIWVLVAIAMVAAIFLVFFIRNKQHPQPQPSFIEDPRSVIDTCVKQTALSILDPMLKQGGFLQPRISKFYNHTNISFLCLNEGLFKPCIMQHPNFIYEMQQELYEVIEQKVEECFLNTKEELEKRNLKVTLKEKQMNISFVPEKVRIELKREMTITKDEKTSSFTNFDSELIYPVYDLGRVAIEIANQEAIYCSFEYVGYMMMYPQFLISKTALRDSTKIYSIQDVHTKKELRIAIRGCAIPSGI